MGPNGSGKSTLAQVLAGHEDYEVTEGNIEYLGKDLLDMEGMERSLAYELASMGIITMENLAEQSIDELLVIAGMDKERAGELIMTARIPWFENEETTNES